MFIGCSNLHILKQYLRVAVSLDSCQNWVFPLKEILIRPLEKDLIIALLNK